LEVVLCIADDYQTCNQKLAETTHIFPANDRNT